MTRRQRTTPHLSIAGRFELFGLRDVDSKLQLNMTPKRLCV